jgi:hypothetical protein
MPYDFNQGDFRQTSEDGTAFGTGTNTNNNNTNNNLNAQGLPMPVTSPTSPSFRLSKRGAKGSSFHPNGEPILLPARNPPPFGIFDIFPLTLLVKPLLRHGFDVGGKLAQKTRAKLSGERPVGASVSHNIPLEITLYLVRASICLWSLVINSWLVVCLHCGSPTAQSMRCAYDQPSPQRLE